MESIYNNLTLEELNNQYNNLTYFSIKRGNNLVTKEYIELYNKLSENILKSNHVNEIDLKYGPHVMNRIDLFKPLNNDRQKLIIWLHGGNWGNVLVSTKEINSFVANGPLKNGFHFASVEYPFNGEYAILRNKVIPESGNTSLSNIIKDVHLAIEYMINYSSTHLNIKKEDIYLCGHSAGAHLVCLEIIKEQKLKKGIFISMISDLEPIYLSYLNDTLKLNETCIQKFSPIRHKNLKNISNENEFLIINGTMETSEFRRQSRSFYEECKKNNINCKYFELEGHGHFSILLELADPDGIISKYFTN